MSDRDIPRKSEGSGGGGHHHGQNPHAEPHNTEINWVPYTVNSHDGLRKLGHEAGVDWHTIYDKNRETLHGKPNLHQAPHTTIMVPDTVERARAHHAPESSAQTIDGTHNHEQKDSVAQLAPAANKAADNDPLKKSTIVPGQPDYIFAAPGTPREKDGDGRNLHFTDGLDMAALGKLSQTDPASAKAVLEMRNALRVASQLTINEKSDDPRLGPQGASAFLRKSFDPVYYNFAQHFKQDFGLSQTAEWKYLQGKSLLEFQPSRVDSSNMDRSMVAAGEPPSGADPLAQKSDGKNPDYIFSTRSLDDQGKEIIFNRGIARSLTNVDGAPMHMTDDLDMKKLAQLPEDDQHILFSMRSVLRTLAQAQRMLGPDVLSQQRPSNDGKEPISALERFLNTYASFVQRHQHQDFGISRTAEWKYVIPESN
jgi:hypothetical protein